MKILFISRLFYPHIGGVEKHVFEISKILIKKGHKITVLTEQYSEDLKIRENIEGIDVIRIPNLKEGKSKKFQIWRWLLSNLKLITDADIIHCHDVFFWYLPFRFLFPQKKVFTTFHGYENYPLRSGQISLHKLSEKLSRGNICVGDFIGKWYGTKPNYVIYGAINNVKKENKVANQNSALFIGRLDNQTGILMYSEAIKIIKKKIPDFDFSIIGEGALRDRISQKIKVLNPLSNASEYFDDYNFAFVSRYLSMLEAMVARRLIFAVYDDPLKEDYLRMSPFSEHIIISNSTSDLISKISFYLENPKEKDKIVRKAYSWARKFTWEKVVNTYLELWSI